MNEKQIKAVKVIENQLKQLKPRTQKDKQTIAYMQVMTEFLLTGKM